MMILGELRYILQERLEKYKKSLRSWSSQYTQGRCHETNEILGIIDAGIPESHDFETSLAAAWSGYVARGAATVDALEDNTQELAFSKGFKSGADWNRSSLMAVLRSAHTEVAKIPAASVSWIWPSQTESDPDLLKVTDNHGNTWWCDEIEYIEV